MLSPVKKAFESAAEVRGVGVRALRVLCLLIGVGLATPGCGTAAAVFNPAFVNTNFGGVVPVTPGPGAAFVLVRAVNATNDVVEFIVTIERDQLVLDENGNFQVDDQGNFITRPERETVRLTTFPTGQSRELGVLFPCGLSPITLVGLGENLLPTDSAVFVGGEGPAGAGGFGVSASELNPLVLEEGNFNCGDTVIFRAFLRPGAAGGIGLESLLLPGSEQPSVFPGPDSFVTFEQLLEAQSEMEDSP